MQQANRQAFALRLAALLLVLAVALGGAGTSALARQWKPSLQAQVSDYLEILDQREGHFILVWWLASPMIPNNPTAAALFDKYVVIVALHAEMDSAAVASYQKIASLDVEDGNHQALTPVPEDKVPPTLTGALSAMGAAFQQLLGPMGQHVQYFVYESGGVNACRHGKLFVYYNGEPYSYDTPIPGC